MTDRKPPKLYMENEADLDNLVIGDRVKVTVSFSEFPSDEPWMVYEGTIDGMESFIEFAGRKWEHSQGTEIYSLRTKKEDVSFREGTLWVDFSRKTIEYQPSSPEYQNARELLEQAGLYHG
ncbi:hypothetical protein GOV03_00265 [Candidatus Woesearchaeota archaeon]|nr:hypothetical protein [Candidatus Woesearchaeota archaeon]